MTDFEQLFGTEPKELPKILLFDFSHLANRMIHSCNNKRLKEGLTEGEMYDFWKHLMMTSIMKEITADNYFRVVIGYDKSPYWRTLLYSDYKGNRKKLREKSKINYETFIPVLEDFVEQFKRSFANFIHIHLDGIECDDIAAVFVRKFSDNHKIRIITADGDYVQLLKYPNVEVFDPIKKQVLTSLNPLKELTLKVLTGDSGDNIPAIKSRVGDATAEKIINNGLDNYLVEEGEVVQKQYNLNRQLIDFDYIPDMVVDHIYDSFINYDIKPYNFTDALSFAVNNKLEWVRERIMGVWSTVLARINRDDGEIKMMEVN